MVEKTQPKKGPEEVPQLNSKKPESSDMKHSAGTLLKFMQNRGQNLLGAGTPTPSSPTLDSRRVGKKNP